LVARWRFGWKRQRAIDFKCVGGIAYDQIRCRDALAGGNRHRIAAGLIGDSGDVATSDRPQLPGCSRVLIAAAANPDEGVAMTLLSGASN
jgi:hypothetical protein